MKRFCQLFLELESSNKTNDKVKFLRNYFEEEKPENAVWALYFLLGNRFKRSVNTRLLREWAAEKAGVSLWLFEESYDHVGDLAETVSLLIPANVKGTERSLADFVDAYVSRLPRLEEETKKELLFKVWDELNRDELFLFHKLIGGNFRTGVAKTLVMRALSQVAGIDQSEMSFRLSGKWEPTVENYEGFLSGESDELANISKPYPFCLAHALEGEVAQLEKPEDWLIEWKWDGIRAQLIRRQGRTILWSRGEDILDDQFPEIQEAGALLPDGTVLDGEILVWRDDRPATFGDLQKRLGRKKVGKKTLKDYPALFMAYDYLEKDGKDFRDETMQSRRKELEGLAANLPDHIPFTISKVVEENSWEKLAELRQESRQRGVEGFMLKKKSSTYQVGRVKGDWWKWKVEPFTCDCVMIYAQAGHGRRANLFTDYTFAVWKDEELVPVMKAYSGLTDKEISEVDRWVRRNTINKFGPVREVNKELVFELAFEGIRKSTRHKSGIAVRFPRIIRWRKDKNADQADKIETLESLLELVEA